MAMLGLVADYGSSDSEQEQEGDAASKEEKYESVNFFDSQQNFEKEPKKEKKAKSHKNKIANPMKSSRKSKIKNPLLNDETTSVFYNPFQKEQEAKTQMLEKHVKLTDNPKNISEINGKKICQNYRKGRCKFGHKCKFAHDSDLNTPVLSKEEEEPTISSLMYNTSKTVRAYVVEEEETKSRKRKPGLAEGLVPTKKSREHFKSQQTKETPWITKR